MYKSFRTFVTMEVILVTMAGAQHNLKSRQDSKIVGGFSINLKQAPFLVSLQQPGIGHYCGGSLITLGSVLTGCHCVGSISKGVKKGEVELRDWKNLTLHAGSEDIDYPNHRAQKRRAGAVKIHPNCSFEVYLIYDYGVIFASSPFVRSPTVRPFVVASWKKLPFELETKKLINNEKIYCMVAGWGAITAKSNKYHYAVQGLRMMLINDADCAAKLGRENTKFRNFVFGENAQMCSLPFGYHKNASDCTGDSGGPFFCGIKVFGLVSYGYDCGYWDTPSVYAKMSYFVEWYQTIKHEESQTSVRSKSAPLVATHTSGSSSPETMILRPLLCALFQTHVNYFWRL